MTAQISAYGRLVADPQTRTTNSGTSMAMGRLAVSLPCNAAAEGPSSQLQACARPGSVKRTAIIGKTARFMIIILVVDAHHLKSKCRRHKAHSSACVNV